MNAITLRQIEVFTQIAQFGNVSKAADALFISQSATSMALAELEKQLEKKLFDRVGRQLVINQNGQRLLPKAIELLDRAQEIESLFQSNSITGKLHIGASSTIGNYLMPKIIHAFSKKYPKVRIQLKVANSNKIIEALLNCEIDIAYIEQEHQDRSLKIIPWRKDELVLIANSKRNLPNPKNIQLSDLYEQAWILREKGSGTRDTFEKNYYKDLKNLNIQYELGHTEAIKQAIIDDLGISMLSRLASKELLENKVLKEIANGKFNLKRNLYQVTRKDRYLSDTAQAFMSSTHEK